MNSQPNQFWVRDHRLSQLDPRAKLMVSLGFVITTSLLPAGAWPEFIVLQITLVMTALVGTINLRVLFRRTWPALIFAAAAVPLVFTIPGSPIFQIPLGNHSLTATLPGLARFATITLKTWLSVQAAVLLALTTSIPQLLMAMRGLHVPRLLVEIIGLTGRYLFVFAASAQRLMTARAARSADVNRTGRRLGGSLFWRATVTGGMAGSLLLRSVEQGDRIYAAMVSRGYDGEPRSLTPDRFSKSTGWTVVSILLVFLLILLLGILTAG